MLRFHSFPYLLFVDLLKNSGSKKLYIKKKKNLPKNCFYFFRTFSITRYSKQFYFKIKSYYSPKLYNKKYKYTMIEKKKKK